MSIHPLISFPWEYVEDLGVPNWSEFEAGSGGYDAPVRSPFDSAGVLSYDPSTGGSFVPAINYVNPDWGTFAPGTDPELGPPANFVPVAAEDFPEDLKAAGIVATPEEQEAAKSKGLAILAAAGLGVFLLLKRR